MNTIPQSCRQVVFSDKAYLSIAVETFERVSTETGGILLGKVEDGVWYVIETLDPGPNSIFTPTYFEYDTDYVNHLGKKVARLWKEPLGLLGLWHRHPGSFDSFSSVDNGTNGEYASLRPDGAISGLVNIDPDFRLTMYHVDQPLRYQRVPVEVGDNLIPSRHKELKSCQTFITEAVPLSISQRGKAYFQPLKDALFKHVGEGSDGVEGSSEEAPDDLENEMVFDMLDIEMKYLNSQQSFECEIKMVGDGVSILMTPVGTADKRLRVIDCLLEVTVSGERLCILDGQKYPWKPNTIKTYVLSHVLRRKNSLQ